MYSYLVLNLGTENANRNALLGLLARITPATLPWASMYWIFAVFTLAMVTLLSCSRFPRVELTADEQAGSLQTYGSLFAGRWSGPLLPLRLRLRGFRTGHGELDL